MRSPMTRPNRHRIGRQLVELAIGTAAQGPAAQQELARPFWDRGIPELEQVFDDAAGPAELLQLDRLELDLGVVGGDDWPADFRRKLIAELTRNLAQFTAVPDGGREGRGDPQPAEAWRQFLFFLSHGRLPWWAATLPRRWTEVLSDGADVDWKALRTVISSNPGARLRLVYSVDDAFLDEVIARWSGVPGAARALEHLGPASAAGDVQRRWRRESWILLLDRVLTGGFGPLHSGPQLVRDLLALRRLLDPKVGSPAGWRSPADVAATADGMGTAEADGLPDPWRGWLLHSDAAPVEPTMAELHAESGARNDISPVRSLRGITASERKPKEVDEEAIYFPGAGAILVHPFLEQLFRECDLLDGRDFQGFEERDRAVHLIGFITFGRVELPEHELLLAKALCGAALDDPIEPVQLDDSDLAACDALLRAVLRHWTALRSSSDEWLRQYFFLREGKLERVDEGWLLTIERNAQDVLLARLPWGLGVVAAPWLTERIFVRWIN